MLFTFVFANYGTSDYAPPLMPAVYQGTNQEQYSSPIYTPPSYSSPTQVSQYSVPTQELQYAAPPSSNYQKSQYATPVPYSQYNGTQTMGYTAPAPYHSQASYGSKKTNSYEPYSSASALNSIIIIGTLSIQ